MAIDHQIDKDAPIPTEVLKHPSLGHLTRLGLHRHYSIRNGWDYSGLFVGDAGNIDELVCFWNLRAADITLHFVDLAHSDRHAAVVPEYEAFLRADLSHLDEHRRNLAIWSPAEKLDDATRLFRNKSMTLCGITEHTWDGGAVVPPMMILGGESSLGVFSRDSGKPKVSFSLGEKPFSSGIWFSSQHLVASVSLIGSLYGEEQYTFHPPYVPELNEFFARTMHGLYNKVRVEPERLGIIIDAADHDSSLNAIPVSALVEKIFEMAKFRSEPSNSGLIVRQLIARLGGVEGARVFKIPGVRRLLKTHGPRASFTKKGALELIGSTGPNSSAMFSDHEHLYIEKREIGTKLTPPMVFAYLVTKGLFRMGVELTCPTCRLPNWITLDSLKEIVLCDLCGANYDATRQLVEGEFQYRRSGVLGLERNNQGAVPVALVLQQLWNNLSGDIHDGIYAVSQNLEPHDGVDLPLCEVDFLMVFPQLYPRKAEIILGECKDEGGKIDAKDVENLRLVADSLPQHRFDIYIVLAKLSPFTPKEIELVKALNGAHQRRAIMLTARELEPYILYERTSKELGVNSHGGTPKELAGFTHQIYFRE